MATSLKHSTSTLSKGWQFKQGDSSSTSAWHPANDLPTEVHRDLYKNEIIQDPFLDLNELSVRWIADESWTYRTSFASPADYGNPNTKTVLVFEGLDTFASVSLNGKVILESSNMFVEHRVDISELLYNGNSTENILEIVFESARQRGLELVREHPEHDFIVHQTEVSRGPVRKAQYHWGWDWGPLLLTCGPWKPVYIETYTARIDDLWLEYDLGDNLTLAKGRIFAKVDGSAQPSFQIRDAADKLVLDGPGELVDECWQLKFEIPIDLWWPRGYGSQHLYTIVALINESNINTSVAVREEKKVGFRKVELVQDQDQAGTSFYFRVNNLDIFSGGSCWIPGDSFLSRISDSTYRDWVELAAQGNQSMIRVWGGGIYEADAFYEACDEFGILVWQDFMFACANYPAYPAYLQSVEFEARQNVRRLRNHPSIALWCGNNEDYQIVERYDLKYDFKSDKNPDSWLKTNFPARYIYEHLLPTVVKKESSGVSYHPSSPFGNGTSTTLKVDPTVGDVHQWNVWHGEMRPYQHLPLIGGRFVSEFGMEAYPHLETLESCITQENERYPGSMAMDFRNKAIGHERRLISYVAENFRIKYDLPNFTHLTQIMQADAMMWAYKTWRRMWGSKGKRTCGGVLVWQLNDCWPTMSWAVVDYNLVPKPAYYTIKRAMHPVTVGVTRKYNSWTMRPADALWKRDTSHIDMRQIWEDVEYDVWVASFKSEPLQGRLQIQMISIRTGRILLACDKSVLIEPNATTEVIQKEAVKLPSFQGPDVPFDTSKADPFVIHVLLSVDGVQIASDNSWPDPIKYLDFADRDVSVSYASDGSTIEITADKPTKGFVFSEKRGVKLSDNGFDLMPAEVKRVRVERGKAEDLGWKYVGI